MKIAIVGSRGYRRLANIAILIDSLPKGSTIVSGNCTGVDICAETIAYGFELPVISFPAQWKIAGHLNWDAGKERNTLIVQECDLLFAFYDGKSRGTADSMRKARGVGKLAQVFSDVSYTREQMYAIVKGCINSRHLLSTTREEVPPSRLDFNQP